MADQRAKIKKENPEMKATEIASKGGEIWREIKDTKEGKKYAKMAEKAKKEYAKAMEEYKSDKEESGDESENQNQRRKNY